jgi:hypothetical protein
MAQRIQVRRGTAEQWTTANPVLASGEPGYETDTGKHKLGDGATAWVGLPYFVDETAIPTTPGEVGAEPAGAVASLKAKMQLPSFLTARYYGPRFMTPTTLTLIEARGFAGAMPVHDPHSFDRIGVEVTTAGSTGAVIRLGLYAERGDGHPGDLVVDAGTVDATTTGLKEITINSQASGPWTWIVVVSQGAAATQPVVRGLTGQMVPLGHSNPPGAANLSGVVSPAGSLAGALSSTFPTSGAAGIISNAYVRAK